MDLRSIVIWGIITFKCNSDSKTVSYTIMVTLCNSSVVHMHAKPWGGIKDQGSATVWYTTSTFMKFVVIS